MSACFVLRGCHEFENCLFVVYPLRLVGSTENVRQFFTDEDEGSEEKSFFESFTASEGNSLEDSANKPAQPLRVDTSKRNT